MRAVLISLSSAFCCMGVWGASEQTKEGEAMAWGALFFSAQERVQQTQTMPIQTSLSYQGILYSMGKKPTYWLNNAMQHVLPKGVLRQKNRLMMQEGEKRMTLVPGETYDMEEQSVIATPSEDAEACVR